MIPTVATDVLIIGSGPAGSSTALHLVQADPGWAGRMVVVDKAVHPREKLCGGGITPLGADVLAGLGLAFEVPHVPVREVQLRYHDLAYAFQGNPAFRVVRRDEFDHWLVQQAEQRGVIVRQGEAVQTITPRPDHIEVVTERATFQAQTVVAADGSRSRVRRKLFGHPAYGEATERSEVPADLPTVPTLPPRMARLLEVLTPEQGDNHRFFQEGVAVFDFSQMAAGLQGYYWDFPSLIRGQAFMNRGLFDSRVRPERPRLSLKPALSEALAHRNHRLADYPLKGHPIHWFNRRAEFARPRVILAGDAAGVDPLLGEGIAFALAYGQVAAATVAAAFERQDFSFASYKQRLLAHPIVGQLLWRRRFAWLVYALRHPLWLRLLWRSMPLIVRALAWCNPYAVPLETPRLIRVKGR